MKVKYLYACIAPLLFISCTAPRVINQSARVSPKGSFTGGVSLTGNVSGQASKFIGGLVRQNIDDIAREDTVYVDQNLEKVNKVAIAYAIDPIGVGYDIYLRYGLFKRTEIGYKLAGKANVFNLQYQFIGPAEGSKNKANRFYGSIALQYAWQKYKLPSVLADVQDKLGYNFKRKDFMVPLIFSYSFGEEEEYGSLSFGVAYSYSQLAYSSVPKVIVNNNGVPLRPDNIKQGYSSLGGFVNVKFGYKHVYLVPSFSFFYQEYGDYKLLSGNTINLSGFSFIPSLSLQFSQNGAAKSKK